MATGFGSLFLLGLAKEQQLWNVPKWVLGLTTFLTFGSYAIGIAYGLLSASWDKKRKGSLPGLEEAKQNWVVVWEEEEEDHNPCAWWVKGQSRDYHLVSFAGLMSGLTLGLMSLSLVDLEVLVKAGSPQRPQEFRSLSYKFLDYVHVFSKEIFLLVTNLEYTN
ncbi:hypothetical protein LWI28_001401 [Acer negundo]|uniref:Uncharacterized protein n=1 Tax=Acer negundo TaxID=4023 RepID=A0AAD5IBK6_ACENE|nr:hypothetical protein LWI28_001401 [Acer negundo]